MENRENTVFKRRHLRNQKHIVIILKTLANFIHYKYNSFTFFDWKDFFLFFPQTFFSFSLISNVSCLFLVYFRRAPQYIYIFLMNLCTYTKFCFCFKCFRAPPNFIPLSSTRSLPQTKNHFFGEISAPHSNLSIDNEKENFFTIIFTTQSFFKVSSSMFQCKLTTI